jgi:hypothetical protein
VPGASLEVEGEEEREGRYVYRIARRAHLGW